MVARPDLKLWLQEVPTNRVKAKCKLCQKQQNDQIWELLLRKAIRGMKSIKI